MNTTAPRGNLLSNRWLTFLIVGFIFLSPALLQGCDGLAGINPHDEDIAENKLPATNQSANSKLRHAALLDDATRLSDGEAGKSGSLSTNLFLGFNEYEADGVTPRVLNKYEVTQRILQEYGITRRILEKYGVTRRVLNQYGITRRILNQYGITRRVLEKYGITRRVLSQYGDLVTDAMLTDYQVTESMLFADGLTQAEIDDFNRLSALLNEYNLTVEEFIDQLEAAIQLIRLKVTIDGAHLGISIEFPAELMDTFLEEISDDPDILFAEPDIAIDTTELGTTSGMWYDKQIVPWGIEAISTPIPSPLSVFWQDYIKENPVHVFILDSGALNNSWWDDLNYVEKKDFTMLFENPEQLMWEDSLAPDVSGFDPGENGNPYDESGHGVHIAGTIGANNDLIGVVGVAPSVKLHSLKVLTKEGRTDITTLLAAVDYITRAKLENPEWPIVVNLSLGVDIGTTAYNVLDEAIKNSIDAGVIYVAAAGNDGRNASTYSPAHVEEVITVGAFNEQHLFAPFSNYGEQVDILAPGENVISLSHIIEDTKAFESILASGTSYAAPHVTGAVARFLGKHPDATASQVAKALNEAAEQEVSDAPLGTTNKILDVERLLKQYDADSDESTGDGYGDTEDNAAAETFTGNVKDEFTNGSANSSDGTHNWAGYWREIGESDGKNRGNLRIVESSRCASGYCLRIDTEEENFGVKRAVNLSNASAASLTFEYRRIYTGEANLHLEVSDDAGATWHRIFTFEEGTDHAQVRETLDISGFASDQTQIRFYTDDEGENKVYIDNIEILF